MSSEGTGSWAGRRGCSSAEGCRRSEKSAVPFALGCTVSPAGQRGERGEVQQSPLLPNITPPTLTLTPALSRDPVPLRQHAGMVKAQGSTSVHELGK